jgi:hypothetical protein
MGAFSALRHSRHSQKAMTRYLAAWSALLSQARPETFESAAPVCPSSPNGDARTTCSNRESRPGPMTITVRFVRRRAQEFPKRLIRLPLSVVWLFHAVRWLERRMATKTARGSPVCEECSHFLDAWDGDLMDHPQVPRRTAVGDPELSQIGNWASKPAHCRGMTMTRERHQRGRRMLLQGSVR